MRLAAAIFGFALLSSFNCSCPDETVYKYNLTTTWDGQLPPDKEEIFLEFSQVVYDWTTDELGLKIDIDAPFYDSPKLPKDIEDNPGRVPGLWNYEVVEVFFLGDNDNYLEVELGPRGHYLVYYLEGVRNVTKNDLLLDDYVTELRDTPQGKRWKGVVTVPQRFFPPGFSKFNAYAIHKSDPDKTYMALFPVPQGKYKEPDFHKLEYFKSFGFNFCELSP